MATKKENTEKAQNTKKEKKVVYVCSNGAVYNKKNDAEEYQKVLDKTKQVEEKEI